MKSIAMAALLMSAAPAPEVGAPLAPVGKWTVDYADNMCVLSHDFGATTAPTTIGFRPVPLGTQTEVALLTPGLIAKPRNGDAVVTALPSGQKINGIFGQIPLREKKQSFARLQLKGDVTPLVADATAITIEIAGTRVAATLPSMKPALAALRTCQDELLREWGIDPAERERMADPEAIGSKSPKPADWITNDDYPSDALNSGRQGTSMILWTIGLDGKVHDCRTVMSSGTPSLDQAACDAITRRGRYAPVLDKQGKPMIAHGVRRVQWILPE